MGTSPKPFGRPREPSSTPTWRRRTEPWSPTTAKAAAPFPCAYACTAAPAHSCQPTQVAPAGSSKPHARLASRCPRTPTQRSASTRSGCITARSRRTRCAPRPSPPPPAAATAGNTRRTAVQLKKQFAAHDSVAEFREAMEEGFELNGWDNATKKQRTHELLNNIHPDIALALITDGAKAMDTTAVFALMATPEARTTTTGSRPPLRHRRGAVGRVCFQVHAY